MTTEEIEGLRVICMPYEMRIPETPGFKGVCGYCGMVVAVSWATFDDARKGYPDETIQFACLPCAQAHVDDMSVDPAPIGPRSIKGLAEKLGWSEDEVRERALHVIEHLEEELRAGNDDKVH